MDSDAHTQTSVKEINSTDFIRKTFFHPQDKANVSVFVFWVTPLLSKESWIIWYFFVCFFFFVCLPVGYTYRTHPLPQQRESRPAEPHPPRNRKHLPQWKPQPQAFPTTSSGGVVVQTPPTVTDLNKSISESLQWHLRSFTGLQINESKEQITLGMLL